MWSNRMKKGVIAFDYDGVLTDTFEPNIRLMNRIFGMMNVDLRIEARHFDLAEEISFEAVVAAAGLPEDRYPEFIRLIETEGYSIIEETFLFAGMKDLIHELHEEYYLCVVSNNHTEIVIPGLEKESVISLFNPVTGNDSGGSKSERLVEIAQKYSMESENCWMIGDGTNDIEAAHIAKWKSAAVTWGFQSESILASKNPTVILQSIPELKSLLLSK